MSSDPLSREAMAAVDPAGCSDDVLAQPLQLGDALWRAQLRRHPAAGPARWPGGLRDGRLGDRRRPGRRRARRPRHAPDPRPSAATASSPGRRRTRSCSAPATRATPRRRSPASRPRGAVGAERVVLTTGGELAGRGPRRGGAGDRRARRDAAARGRALHDGRRARVRRGLWRGARGPRPRSRPPRRCSSGWWRPGGRTRSPIRRPRRSPARSSARCRWSTAPARRPRSPGAGPPSSTRTPRWRPSPPSFPRRTTTRSAAGSAGAARPRSRACSSRTRTTIRACATAWT